MLTIKCPHCDGSFTVTVQLHTEVLPTSPPENPAQSGGSATPCSNSKPPEHAFFTPPGPSSGPETPPDSPSSPQSFSGAAASCSGTQSGIKVSGSEQISGVRRSARLRKLEAAQILDDLNHSTSSEGLRRSRRLKRVRYRRLLGSFDLDEMSDGSSSHGSGASNTGSERSNNVPAIPDAICNDLPDSVACTGEVTTDVAMQSTGEEEPPPQGVTVDGSQLEAGWVEHAVSRQMKNALRKRRYGLETGCLRDVDVKTEDHSDVVGPEEGRSSLPDVRMNGDQRPPIGEVKQELSSEQLKVE